MNKKAKDMFDKLHEYCTDNEYQIIEVYFQDGEAVLLDNFSQVCLNLGGFDKNIFPSSYFISPKHSSHSCLIPTGLTLN